MRIIYKVSKIRHTKLDDKSAEKRVKINSKKKEVLVVTKCQKMSKKELINAINLSKPTKNNKNNIFKSKRKEIKKSLMKPLKKKISKLKIKEIKEIFYDPILNRDKKISRIIRRNQ